MIIEAVIDAEIMWALDVVMSNYSFNSSSSKKDLFKDGKIAPSFTCSTKFSYMINFGLAPYFQELLQVILTDASFYVPSIDESHNSTLKNGEMDLHVRFWENSSNIAQTHCIISCLVGKVTAQDVYENFKECSTP